MGVRGPPGSPVPSLSSSERDPCTCQEGQAVLWLPGQWGAAMPPSRAWTFLPKQPCGLAPACLGVWPVLHDFLLDSLHNSALNVQSGRASGALAGQVRDLPGLGA